MLIYVWDYILSLSTSAFDSFKWIFDGLDNFNNRGLFLLLANEYYNRQAEMDGSHQLTFAFKGVFDII
jgi:hypothetical protein